MKMLWLPVALTMACGPMGTYESTMREDPAGWDAEESNARPRDRKAEPLTWVRGDVTFESKNLAQPFTYLNLEGEEPGLASEYGVRGPFVMLPGDRFSSQRIAVRGTYASLGYQEEDNPCFPILGSVDELDWEFLSMEVIGDPQVLSISAPSMGTTTRVAAFYETTLHPGVPGDVVVRTKLKLKGWPEVTDWRDKTVGQRRACEQHMEATIGHETQINVPVSVQAPARYSWSTGEAVSLLEGQTTNVAILALDAQGESLNHAINWNMCDVLDEVWFSGDIEPTLHCARNSSWAFAEATSGADGAVMELRMPAGPALRMYSIHEDRLTAAELRLNEFATRRMGSVLASADEDGTFVAPTGYQFQLGVQWFDHDNSALEMSLGRDWVEDVEITSTTPEVCVVTEHMVGAAPEATSDPDRRDLTLVSPGTCDVTLRVQGATRGHSTSLSLKWREGEMYQGSRGAR